ncbi:MAG: NAD+ synthase [Candidatus Aenigmarchaeota archaeon]|nr:NAD+ synthase [Candidatus Aenigmarchaeota archaeon]
MKSILAKAIKIQAFIKRKVKESRSKGAVIGLSGGIDSSLVCFLAARALGRKRVIGISLPDSASSPRDMQDAKGLAKLLKIRHKTHSIAKIVKAFDAAVKRDKKSLGNLKARIRMCVLYSYANSLGYLVLGTGNRSELLSGYFTKYGDGGVDALPIGSLYKTQVWEMSRELGLPKGIIEKAPSAGLWKGQTDEKEMGIKYADLDRILHLMTEKKMPIGKISKNINVSKSVVSRAAKMVSRSKHKLSMPEIC